MFMHTRKRSGVIRPRWQKLQKTKVEQLFGVELVVLRRANNKVNNGVVNVVRTHCVCATLLGRSGQRYFKCTLVMTLTFERSRKETLGMRVEEELGDH
jgi:hypothetical protein